MNGGLPAIVGFDGNHRQAVGLHAAIAAALAHRLVDEHPLLRRLQLPALALPALLGGALLVEQDNGHAGHLFYVQHHLVVIRLGGHADLRADAGLGIAVHVLRDDHHLRNPIGLQLPCQVNGRSHADHLLPAGHGDRRVV